MWCCSRPLPTSPCALANHCWLPDVRLLLRTSDHCSLRGCSTVWERCAHRRRTRGLRAAENKSDRERWRTRAAHYLGRSVVPLPISRDGSRRPVVDAAKRDTLRTMCACIVDGLWASRVVPACAADLLRLASRDKIHAPLLFGWANDATVRAMSFSTASISWDDHVRWLDDPRALNRPHVHRGRSAGDDVGMVLFDEIGPDTMEIAFR